MLLKPNPGNDIPDNPKLFVSTESQLEYHEETAFEEQERILLSLVRDHKINEIIVFFGMDQFHIRIPLSDLRRLFCEVQNEVIREFGAPLSLSLFPEILFSNSQSDSIAESN